MSKRMRLATTVAGFTALLAAAGPGSAEQKSMRPITLSQAYQKLAQQSDGPLPAGTKLINVKMLPGGTAVVNFSRQLRDNFHGGDSQELKAVNAIMQVAALYQGVRRVWVLVNGAPVDSLGGLLVIADPMTVTHSLQ